MNNILIKLLLSAISLQKEKLEKKKLEKRLRLAEDSLKRLDAALRDSGIKVSLEIEADVTTLKCKFCEICVRHATKKP